MRSLPLIKSIGAAWIPILLLNVLFPTFGWDLAQWYGPVGLLFFGLGMLYTHFFVYWYHRYPMHRYYRIASLRHIKDAHTEHHRAFPGSRLNIRPDELLQPFEKMGDDVTLMNEMISQRWWVYPVLLIIHMAALAVVASPVSVLMWGFGSVVQYTIYDVSHWFTHVRPTRFGAFVERLPYIGNLWKLTVQVHDVHHQEVESDFNFTPPWLGDMLGGTFATHVTPRTKKDNVH